MTTRLHSPAFPLLSDFDRQDGGGKPDHEVLSSNRHSKTAISKASPMAAPKHRPMANSAWPSSEVLHATQLDEERQSWHRDCADVLAARFDASVKLIERNIEDRVAVLLRPWLIERLRERALQDLEKAIARALSEGAKVHIEAPAEVLAQLRERLPTEALQIGYSDSGSPDIRAHIEDTEIEANISAWIAELEAATA